MDTIQELKDKQRRLQDVFSIKTIFNNANATNNVAVVQAEIDALGAEIELRQKEEDDAGKA
jgi:hypothetical protein